VALQPPAAALAVMLAGQVMPGNWPSVTVTIKAQVVLLPPVSVFFQVTVVVPTGN
jgi:hypothetical protein